MRTLPLLLLFLLHATAALAGPRLAVLDFQVASPDPAHEPLGDGLRSMLATDLSRAPDVVLVERARLQEVLAELELQEGKQVDPDTAIKVGRLLGATHLVDGSVTVSGETMRLDARLVDIERGTVALGESVEGERLAFFELEKDLVRRLVAGMALTLAPKERAAIGRLHTADWDAFVAFSQGVHAFDEERYDEALAALDRAIAVDGEFDLADLTQKEYATIIERLRQRGEALRTAAIEEEKLEASKEAAAELAMLRELEALAAREGAEHAEDRLTALSVLHALYRDRELRALNSEIDRFHGQRLADHYLQRYVAEAQERWGEIAPDPRGSIYIKAEAWREAFAKEKERIHYRRWDADKRDARAARDLTRCTSSSDWAEGLYLDLGERADRCAARGQVAAALVDDAEEHATFGWQLAHDLRRVGRYDQATRLLLAKAELEDNAHRVDGLRKQIEQLRAYERAIDGANHPELVREGIVLGPGRRFFGEKLPDFLVEHVGGRRMSDKGLWAVSVLRRMNNRRGSSSAAPYLLVDDTPLWLPASALWTTGPRPDPLRTEVLHYYRPADHGEARRTTPIDTPTLALYGERMRRDLRLSLTVHHEPDGVWWPLDVRYRDGGHGVQPEPAPVALVLGARDMRVPPRRIPGQDAEHHRPFRAWLLVIDADEIRLEALEGRYEYGEPPFARTVLERMKRRGQAGEQTRVQLDVSEDGAVKLSLDGKTHRLQIPDYTAGYPGLFMTEVGYARFEELELR